MSHRREPSDGLNIGEGFPTSYSSFAVTTDVRDDGRRSSASQRKPAMRKRRSSSPRISEAPRMHGHVTPSSPKFTFETSEAVLTTKKSAKVVLEGFKKRWLFVVFFVAFSALIGLGTLLPVSRTAKPLRGAALREETYLVRATRSPLAKPEPVVRPNRFARWAAALFGNDGLSTTQPIPFSAGIGDLNMPDVIASQEGNRHPHTPPTVGSESAPARRRGGKRRTPEEIERDAREHPSRAARRAQRSESLAEEVMERERQMAKRKQLRNKVMERVARAFKGTEEAPAAVDEEEGGQFVDPYDAAHPEVIDLEGAFSD